MNDKTEKGAKWWIRYVIVPIVVACISGGGIYTVTKLILSQNEETTIRPATETPFSREPGPLNDETSYYFKRGDMYSYEDKKNNLTLQLECEEVDVNTKKVKFLIHNGQIREEITFNRLGQIYSFQYNNIEYQIKYLEIHEEESLVKLSVGWKS
jgi:hypothetical protein